MINKAKVKIKIEQIVNLFKDNFPLGWANAFSWEQGHDEESCNALKEKVNAFEYEIFPIFAQSVLNGEYLIRNDFPKTIDSLYELLTNAELYDDEVSQYKTIAFQSFNEMTYEFSGVLRRLRYLLTMLKDKYEEKQNKFVVNAYRRNKERSSESTYGRFYDMLLDITQIDHFLSYDRSDIRCLILYHNELSHAVEDKNLPEDSIKVLDILNEKCLFLLKKLLIDDEKVFDYMIDFKPYHYDARELSFKYFSCLDSRFEFYREDNYSNDPIGDELDMKARKNKLPIGWYPLLMKYYVDSKSTRRVQIENILGDFDTLYNSLSLQFTQRPLDIYALGTLKNYMYNCLFSFKMKSSAYSFELLKNDLDNIIEIQHQTGIFNFYPYGKAIHKVLELLRSDDSLRKETLVEYKKFLDSCKDKFEESIKWCRTNCFYPIQNCYRECLVPVPDFGAVFMASSYCRPIKYEKQKDELNTIKNQVLLVENEIALREEKIQLKNLKKDIDNSRIREVEVLSVFTAIITFLFGSIGFFADNKNNDFLHLLFSIFGLGAILLIFVSGIHLMTMRKEEKVVDYFKHPRAWFCFFTIAGCVGLLIWLVIKVTALTE